jgi:hypothetical protein
MHPCRIGLLILLRATVLASLAALTLSTHVFVTIDRLRVKIVRAPAAATAGVVRANTAAFPHVNELHPPFAFIARIESASAGTSRFSIVVDGAPICERSVSGGGSRRIDCAVAGEWNPTVGHELVIQGPPTAWALTYLELATHHGNTNGAHYLVVLPASSGHYSRPGPGWVIATWLMLFAAVVLLPSPSLPRWSRRLYGVVVGAVVLELTLIQTSQWISNYRIVLSIGTFTKLLMLLFVPRLWLASRQLAQTATTRYLNLRPTARRRARRTLAAVLFCVAGVTAWERVLKSPWEQFRNRRHAEQRRARLLAELQPIKLANCEFQRFGETNDGGYLLCANLLGAVQSAYSYGISGYDQWGCDITHRLSVPVHEYDCFNLQQPGCPGGQTIFHGECVAGERATIDGRLFDTLENQFATNGDGAKRLVVKMDVEGAEWDSLFRASDDVLQQIDQLTIELHGVHEPDRFTAVVAKLKRLFYVANLHFNNFSCLEGIAPFPAEAYEVLFVNKRVGVPGEPGPAGAPAALMAPNNPEWKDCQTVADLPPIRPSVNKH